MAIVDLFSKREKKKRVEGKDDVFQYDNIPPGLRVQIIHIWADALGVWQQPYHYYGHNRVSNDWWSQIFKMFTREKEVFQLAPIGSDPFDQCQRYLQTADTEDALDIIELTFRWVDRVVRDIHPYRREQEHLADPDEAIDELNARFREHGVGYEYSSGEIIRVDSKYLHAEAVKPALTLLQGAGKLFSGPLDEFLKAHEHYRKGEAKDAISWALKAFESTLKAICTARSWPFDPQKDTASKLLEIVFANGLVPSYLQNQFTALRSLLESGV